jgi:hypothetical protein
MRGLQLDRLEQPVTVCDDPACPWARLPVADHFDRHNRLCARLVDDGLCGLMRDHSGDCRPATLAAGE